MSKTVWAGRAVSAVVSFFCFVDGGMKLFQPAVVMDVTVGRLGYPADAVVGIGVAMLLCTMLYVVPRTAVLGAVLLTGYLGGAVASQVRVNEGWFGLLFPVAVAALAWLGLWLRDERVPAMLAPASGIRPPA